MIGNILIAAGGFAILYVIAMLPTFTDDILALFAYLIAAVTMIAVGVMYRDIKAIKEVVVREAIDRSGAYEEGAYEVGAGEEEADVDLVDEVEVGDDEPAGPVKCFVCRSEIPDGQTVCPSCGWSYKK